MALPTLTAERYTLTDLQNQYSFTLSWARGHPAVAPYRQSYEDFQGQITKNITAESELQQKINDFVVASYLIDRELNDLAKQVIALLPLQKDQDPATLQEHLLGGQPFSKFVRPVLGGQLTAMKTWVSVLKASSHSELQSLSSILDEKTSLATKIEQELSSAERALFDFLKIGDRVKLFTDFHTLRNTLYTGVGKDNSELAEELFLHDVTRASTLEASIRDSQSRVERLQSNLDAEKNKLADLEAKKSARDEEEAQRRDAQEKLALLKQQKAALKQQEAQLKAQAKKRKK